ncbi:MAG: C39 family peptidase [Nanoarchaeota archaeon]|nr:C39 family peptidase [Nanoarchaeota archaeon]
MKNLIKIPLIKIGKEREMYCGPIVLSSILNYFGKEKNYKELAKEFGGDVSKGSSPFALTYVALKEGLNVDYLSEFKHFSNNNSRFSDNLKAFWKMVDMEKVQEKYLGLISTKRKFIFIKKRPEIADLKRYLDEKKPIILGLNANELGYEEQSNFPTHYVLVTGYDEKNIFFHTTWPKNLEYEKLSFNSFERAWSSNGWTKDIIIPYLNKSK